MERPSFEDVFQQVAWELCVEAAAKAKTELAVSFFADGDIVAVPNIDTAVEKLISNRDGGIRISGTWIAGGKQGTLDLVCDEPVSPTVTEFYMVRLVEDMVRMQIAKKLYKRGSPTIESLEKDR